MNITTIFVAFVAAVLGQALNQSSTGQNGTLTLNRLKVLITASEAQRLASGNYPPQALLNQQLGLAVRAFSRNLPYRDEWGTPFRISSAGDGRLLTIQSAGPDRQFSSNECGDDYLSQNGKILCPKTISFTADAASIRKTAQRITMARMRAIAATVEAYKMDHGSYPQSINDFHRREPVYASSNFPQNDALGTPFSYIVLSKGKHFRLVSAGPDRRFETSNRVSAANATSPNEAGLDIVLVDSEFQQAPVMIEAELDKHTWPE